MWIPFSILCSIAVATDDETSPFVNNHFPMVIEPIPSAIDTLPGSYGRTRTLRRDGDLDPHVVTQKGEHLLVTVSPGNYAGWHVALDNSTAAFDIAPAATGLGDRILAVTTVDGLVEFSPTATDRHIFNARVMSAAVTDARTVQVGTFTTHTSTELAILSASGLSIQRFDLLTETFGTTLNLATAADDMITLDYDGNGKDDFALLSGGTIEIIDANGTLLQSDTTSYTDLRAVRTRSSTWTDQLTVFARLGVYQFFRTYALDAAGQPHAEEWRELGLSDLRAPVAMDLDEDGHDDVHALSGWNQSLVHMLSSVDDGMPNDVFFEISPTYVFSTDYADKAHETPAANFCEPTLVDFDQDSDVDLFLHNQQNSENALVRGPFTTDLTLRVGPLNSEMLEEVNGHTLSLTLLRPDVMDTAVTHVEVTMWIVEGSGEGATESPVILRSEAPSSWFDPTADDTKAVIPLFFTESFDPTQDVIYLEMRLVQLDAQGDKVQQWTPVHAVGAASQAITEELHDYYGDEVDEVALEYVYLSRPTHTLGIGCVVCLPLVIPPPAPTGGD